MGVINMLKSDKLPINTDR